VGEELEGKGKKGLMMADLNVGNPNLCGIVPKRAYVAAFCG